MVKGAETSFGGTGAANDFSCAMTKTLLILLVGGAAALASLVLGNGLSTSTVTRAPSLTWTQPPILAPRPGDQIIIIKGVSSTPAGLLAWTQPPILAPLPGDRIIIIRGVERRTVATA